MNGKPRAFLVVVCVSTIGVAIIGGAWPALAGSTVTPKTIHFPGPATGTYGRVVTLAATGDGGSAPVVFSVDASSGDGVCAVSGTSGSTLTYTALGSCVIDANQDASVGFPAPAQAQRAISVSPAPLRVSFGDLTRRYGQNITAPTRYVGLVNGDSATTVGASLVVTITSVADHTVSTASASTPAGSYVVDGTGIGGNYTPTYVAGALTVNPSPLRVTVTRSTRTVGQPDPVFPVTYRGFVNGDTPASLGGALTFTATRKSVVSSPTSPPGVYTVAATGLSATNYAITYVSGTMRVLTSFPTDIMLSNSTVPENEPVATVIGTLSAADPVTRDSKTFTLASGSGDDDNADFHVDGTTLETAASFDFETKAAYTIRVRVTETHGLTYEQVIPITITNVDEAPTAIALDNNSVSEGLPIGSPVGTLTDTDPDAGDTAAYSLAPGVGDTDNAAFQIDGTTLETNAVFDVAAQSTYSVLVQVSDSGGLTFTQQFTITITPAPLTLGDDAFTVDKYYDTTVAPVATTLDVLANDTDGSAPMTITAVTQPVHGTVTIAADGQSVSYLPTLDYCNHSLDPGEADTPADAFTYTVNGTATANVAVTVDAVAAAPISRQIYRDRGPQLTLLVPTSPNVYGNKTADTISNSSSSGPTTLDATDSTDPATCGASTFPLTYHWLVTYLAPNQLLSNDYRDFGMTGFQSGSLVIASNSLIPSVSPNSGAHFMLVITSSLTGMSSPTIDIQAFVLTTTLTIQIFQECQQGSDACLDTAAKPTAADTLAVADGTTVAENSTSASVVDVLANDTGPGAKTVTQVTQPAHGTVTIAPDGSSVSYLPNLGYCSQSPDTFFYTINNNSTASVSVEVDCSDSQTTSGIAETRNRK